MKKRIWKSCKNCGNRYPEKEGVGLFKEFCCDGCNENWEQKHPGYNKTTKKKKMRQSILKIFILFFFFILFWLITVL